MSTPTEKGQSFVSQIKAANEALKAAHANKLSCALRLGEVLNLAKETVTRGKKKSGLWAPWLELHCSEISHRTANIYMKLAENKNLLEEYSQHAANIGVEKDLSIRGALEAVNKALGNDTKKAATKTTTKSEAEQDDDPEDDDAQALAGLDVEAVLRGMEECWDAQQRKRLLSEQIKSVQPWDLALMVEDVWEPGKRKELIDELSRHSASAPPPSSGRRPDIRTAAQATV